MIFLSKQGRSCLKIFIRGRSPFISRSRSAAASYAIPWRSWRTLERGTWTQSQITGSLSTPKTATWSGICIPAAVKETNLAFVRDRRITRLETKALLAIAAKIEGLGRILEAGDFSARMQHEGKHEFFKRGTSNVSVSPSTRLTSRQPAMSSPPLPARVVCGLVVFNFHLPRDVSRPQRSLREWRSSNHI